MCWCSPSRKQYGWAYANQGHKGGKEVSGWEDTTIMSAREISEQDGYTSCQGVACASAVEENHLSVTRGMGKKTQWVQTLGS